MMTKIEPYLKAIAAAAVGAATYIITTGADVGNVAWWAGLIIFVAAGFGVVWAVPNKSKSA